MFTYTTPPNLPELDAITTNGKRQYNIPNGDKYPSITTILGAKEKPALKEWRNMLGGVAANKETKRCADRGTAIHKMCELYLSNSDTPHKGYHQDHIKGFNQLKFQLNNIDNIRAQEVALYSEYLRVAGRVDCIAEFNGVLSVIDFKTSNNNKSLDLVHDYFLQCCFYALAYAEQTGILIENLVILMAVEKGMVPMVYTANIEEYLPKLLSRISNYHKENN